jgi:NAD(P)-dependent dehydrogenase (short-subunit alcohol dehydrogenase family)
VLRSQATARAGRNKLKVAHLPKRAGRYTLKLIAGGLSAHTPAATAASVRRAGAHRECRGYDAVRAYGQSKLAQIMFTLDLAEELDDRQVTANCLDPASFMPTKIVEADGIDPASPPEDGVRATLRLATEPELDRISGVFYNGLRAASPHKQATDRMRGSGCASSATDCATSTAPRPPSRPNGWCSEARCFAATRRRPVPASRVRFARRPCSRRRAIRSSS